MWLKRWTAKQCPWSSRNRSTLCKILRAEFADSIGKLRESHDGTTFSVGVATGEGATYLKMFEDTLFK